MGYRALLDANVLVPANVRDVLLTLAHVDLYVPLWSVLILEEAERNLPTSMVPDARAALFREMATAFPDAEVQVPSAVDVRVADVINEKDRHVVAAALVGAVDVVVTEDSRLIDEVDRLGTGHNPVRLEAQKPDVFAGFAIDVDASAATSALIAMGRRWLSPAERAANSDADVLTRLVAWCERRDWTTTAYRLSRGDVLANLAATEARDSSHP